MIVRTWALVVLGLLGCSSAAVDSRLSASEADGAASSPDVLAPSTGGHSGSGGAGAALACGDGETRLCNGPGHCAGSQRCRFDRTGWDACVCTAATGGATAGDAGDPPDALTSSETGAGGVANEAGIKWTGGVTGSGGATGTGGVTPSCSGWQKFCGGQCVDPAPWNGCEAQRSCDPCPGFPHYVLGAAICSGQDTMTGFSGAECDVSCFQGTHRVNSYTCSY